MIHHHCRKQNAQFARCKPGGQSAARAHGCQQTPARGMQDNQRRLPNNAPKHAWRGKQGGQTAARNPRAQTARATGAQANHPRPTYARRSTGQAHRTLHLRPRAPLLRKPAAQNTPPVASASAAILERLRTACHETLHPSAASRANAGSSTACVQGLCNRPWAAQCLTTARLSPEIRTRLSPSGRS